MKYEEIRAKVNEVFRRIDDVNRKAGFKKFYPFSSYRSNRLFEYGIYNYESKKYVHFYSQSLDPVRDMKEFESFIR